MKKYIKNTGRYAVAFTIQRNDREFKLELDKRRIYTDTGNIATSGITPVTEEDIEELKKQKRFNQMIESNELEILDEKDVKSPEENRIKTLEQENKELLNKLKKAEKADVKKMEDENKALADENATLRAQLEALGANKDTKPAKDKVADIGDVQADTEGF